MDGRTDGRMDGRMDIYRGRMHRKKFICLYLHAVSDDERRGEGEGETLDDVGGGIEIDGLEDADGDHERQSEENVQDGSVDEAGGGFAEEQREAVDERQLAQTEGQHQKDDVAKAGLDKGFDVEGVEEDDGEEAGDEKVDVIPDEGGQPKVEIMDAGEDLNVARRTKIKTKQK